VNSTLGPRPDFFIVGAFKAGTTALYEYLRAHPQVFMPFHKEPNFFGDDLIRHYGRLTVDEYLALFRAAAPGQRVGEASTWYLYSASAATEIEAFSPGAQVIVSLRNPIDVMYAQHSQQLFRGDETLADFAAALAAEPARRRGQGLPGPPARPETFFYRHSVRFAAQLERYLDVFGPERMHVLLFDELVADAPTTYRAVLEFLGVDSRFEPAFAVHNENKRVRSSALQKLVFRPPTALLGVARWLRRFPLAHRIRETALSINSSAEPRNAMDARLRDQLAIEFRPEIERLARLIGRNLDHWLAAAQPDATSS
jgi:hypothetical protein